MARRCPDDDAPKRNDSVSTGVAGSRIGASAARASSSAWRDLTAALFHCQLPSETKSGDQHGHQQAAAEDDEAPGGRTLPELLLWRHAPPFDAFRDIAHDQAAGCLRATRHRRQSLSGLWFLQGSRRRDPYRWALTLRIGLSISLFVLLLLSYRFGLVPGYSQ